METYRLSSKLRDRQKEYLIQTANDAGVGAVATTVYVDGVLAEMVTCPHPSEAQPEEILGLVKTNHDEKKREIEGLLRSFRRVLESRDPDTMYQLGTALFYKGFLPEARELLAASAEINPAHHQSLFQLGQVELGLKNVNAALSAAQAAVTARPKYADYRCHLGEVWLAAEEPKKAIEQFEAAIAINLYYADAYFDLGLARLTVGLAAGRHDESQRNTLADAFHKAALILPTYKGREFDEGIQAIMTGELGRALRSLRAVREQRRESHRQQAAAFHMRTVTIPEWSTEKAIAERIAFLTAEIKRNPSYIDMQAELAYCYLEQARLVWHKGIEQYRRTFDVNPTLPTVSSALERAEQAYEHLCSALSAITDKS